MIFPNKTKGWTNKFQKNAENKIHPHQPKTCHGRICYKLVKKKRENYPQCVKKHPKYLDPYHPPCRLLPPTKKQEGD